MKTLFISLMLCFMGMTLSAQETVRLLNLATGKYLNTQNETLQVSNPSEDSKSAHWQFLKNENGDFRIKNVQDGTYLNIETLKPQSTAIEAHWWSPLWIVHPLEGTEFIRIQSKWKPDLYLTMNNELRVSTITDESKNALWEKEIVELPVDANESPAASLFDKQKALDAHNKLRAEVGVPPLLWSEDLAFKAQLWAEKLAAKSGGVDFFLEHSGPAENLAGGWVAGDPPEANIFNGWGENEKPNFNPATRKCYEGKICGHYTQVVWRKTLRVGCGIGVNANGKYVLVCNYDPAGNKNQEPAF